MSLDERISLLFFIIIMPVFWLVIWQNPKFIPDPDYATVSTRLIPIGCSVLIFVLALAKLLYPNPENHRGVLITRGHYFYLLLASLILAAAIFLIPRIGFWYASVIFVFANFLLAGERNILRLLIFSGALVGVSYLLVVRVAGIYVT